jgi:hypothetical protein
MPTMIDFYLDPVTHDRVIDDSGLAILVSGSQAVAQMWKTRLLIGLGEWPLDITAGVDWRNMLSLGLLRSQIVEQSLEVPGITALLDLQFVEISPGRLAIQASAETDQGESVEIGVVI